MVRVWWIFLQGASESCVMLLLNIMLLLFALYKRICPRVHVPKISSLFACLSTPVEDHPPLSTATYLTVLWYVRAQYVKAFYVFEPLLILPHNPHPSTTLLFRLQGKWVGLQARCGRRTMNYLPQYPHPQRGCLL